MTSNPTISLKMLTELTARELTELYESAKVPTSMAALEGAPRGRMLAIAGIGGPAASMLRRFAASSSFPWAGKSFDTASDETGTGINRIRLGGARNWFPFETRIEPSAIDGEPCVVLDYDLPANPWVIRHIHDELREVAPNLFLGPAMWKRKRRGPALMLYFAIDKTATAD